MAIKITIADINHIKWCYDAIVDWTIEDQLDIPGHISQAFSDLQNFILQFDKTEITIKG
jgi:hypothetical protein